ncbi:MAG: hypothetical protein WC716_07380 [Chitinophagaceae bacterium]|jgi:hypothetical protein
MNLQLDIQTLQDLKALLQKLSFHVERTTIEKLYQKYKNIVNNQSHRHTTNEVLQKCKADHSIIENLIQKNQPGDAKIMLLEKVTCALLALTYELEQL